MKYNTPQGTKTLTVNRAGGEAYSQDSRLAFISILLTSFVKSQFYRSEDETVQEVSDLIQRIPDKKFVAKAAIYARTKYGMRSISHVVASEIGKTVKGESWTKDFFDKIVYRPDDLLEILACSGIHPIPNAMKKGFATALRRFDEYQIAKYRKEGATVSMIDAVNLVRPKATEALTKLMKGTLQPAETWETKLVQAGQEAETEEDKALLKGKAWKDLVLERKIGYFALLRNIRNILEQAPEIVDQACALLTDEQMIKKSLVLPFRFTTALEEISKVNFEGSRKVMIALNKALDIAVNNVPVFDGKTLVVVDSSGSMDGKPAQIASLFAAILVKSNDADLMLFSDNAQYVTVNPMDSTITIARSIPFISGGTNFHAIFQKANRAYDRVIILSDMQGWIGGDTPVAEFNAYKTRVGANPLVYSFDLQGYGTMQFPQDRIFCLAGFSDKVFDVMKLLEQDKNALIHEIEKVEL